MHKKHINYYTGNYDQYVQTRAELEENQMKRYRWEQEQISHMKVSRGASADASNNVKQLKIREGKCKQYLDLLFVLHRVLHQALRRVKVHIQLWLLEPSGPGIPSNLSRCSR
jgi:ATPase subunit of ABC transporter with duplicated ATPase domains